MAYEPDSLHRRPEHADDDAVRASGLMSEALETTERARGHLYTFHQLTGHADLALDKVVEALNRAGHRDLAEQVATRLVGLDVIPGHWTFQIVEEYDEGYFQVFREMEELVRERLVGGRRHVYEAEMKQRRSP